MNKPYVVIIALVFVIISLTMVQVVVSNRLSTTGLALGKLEESISEYKNENTVLKEKVLIVSSLTYIASSAAKLGFVQTKTPVFLSTPLPLALKQ